MGRFPSYERISDIYTLTRICSVEYTKRVEPVFELIAEPNRRAILNLLWTLSNATSTTWINPHQRKGRQGEDDAAQTANVTKE